MAQPGESTSSGYGPSRRLFTGKQETYKLWETRFLNYLYTLDKDGSIHKAITTTTGNPDKGPDRRAYAEITQVLDERSLQLIMNDAEDSGQKALKILRTHYQSTEKPRILSLYKELTTLSMQPTEDITDYVIRADTASTGLRAAGEELSDNLIIAMLLKGLPSSYDSFVTVHTQLDKQKSLTRFKADLRAHADTATARSEDADSNTALSLHAHGRSTSRSNYQPSGKPFHSSRPVTKSKPNGSCNACGKNNHFTKDCRNRSQLKCTFCLREGHVESVCFAKKRGDKRSTATANVCSDTTDYTFHVHDYVSKCYNITNASTDIVVDCGATSHMVNDPALFISYDDSFTQNAHILELADGTTSNELVTARGDASITIRDTLGKDHTVRLKNALLVPSFPNTLFSVAAATKHANNVSVHFSHNVAYLQADNHHFNLKYHNNLYYLPTIASDKSYAAKTLEEWHLTLGHHNFHDLSLLPDVTRGMKIIPDGRPPQSCTTCDLNKQTRTAKSNDEHIPKATVPLQRVHTDICGPIKPASHSGHMYLINFVDEFSSMLFTYPLRSKDEAYVALKQFVADVAPIGTVKEIHSDNGGEYVGQSFKDVLLNNGIKQSTTAPYSPFQNGKSERNWRSVLDMARCMLADSGVSKTYWTYSVNQASYLRNRAYQQRTSKTAYELFTGYKPDMSIIHRFGSPCTIYKELKPGKLDTRSDPGIYLGINQRSQGHYLLNVTTNKIVSSRNFRITSSPSKTTTENNTNLDLDNDVTLEHVQLPQPDQSDDDCDEQPRNEKRATRRPRYLDDYVCYKITTSKTVPLVPMTYEEAIQSPEANYWKQAMKAEVDSLVTNDTYELVPLPPGRTETKGKWVFTIKQGQSEQEFKFKARYVARGFSQIYGADYDETYSPTTRFTSIRTLLQYATNNQLVLHQMDVKGAYLNAPIDKDIYVQQPPGFVQTNNQNEPLTCHLKRSLYGLKQSGRNWHITLTDYLRSVDFICNDIDPCMYTRKEGNKTTIILFWVDDIIIAGPSTADIDKVKQLLENRFRMDDRGTLNWFLGIDFEHKDNTYTMSQKRYIESLLSRFKMEECNAANTPADSNLQLTSNTEATNTSYPYRQLIGSLIYLSMGTRPDICWVVSKLSQYLDKPSDEHITAAKRVLRYLKKTKHYSLTFSPSPDPLHGYSDADWGGDHADRRSTTGYIFMYGKTPISWNSRKQPTVALSSTEAELMAITEATKEAAYLRKLFRSLDITTDESTVVYGDNLSALAMTKPSAKQHQRSKHMDIRYQYVRQQTEVKYEHVSTDNNVADILTKPLASTRFKSIVDLIPIEGGC